MAVYIRILPAIIGKYFKKIVVLKKIYSPRASNDAADINKLNADIFLLNFILFPRYYYNMPGSIVSIKF